MSPVLPACNLNEVDDGLKHLFIHFLSSQERISHLEEDLCDERGSADRLMERLDKTKEQAGLLPCCLCCFFCVVFFPDEAHILHFSNAHKFPSTKTTTYQ